MNRLNVILIEPLVIRPFVLEDINNVYKWTSDLEVMQYITCYALSFEQTEKSLNNIIKNYADPLILGMRAIALMSNNMAIGYCGLGKLPHIEEDLVEIYYGINREYWNKGYATTATLALLNHAFYHFGLEEVVCAINPKNLSSIKVANKLGFSYWKNMNWPQQGEVFLFRIDKFNFEKLSMK